MEFTQRMNEKSLQELQREIQRLNDERSQLEEKFAIGTLAPCCCGRKDKLVFILSHECVCFVQGLVRRLSWRRVQTSWSGV